MARHLVEFFELPHLQMQQSDLVLVRRRHIDRLLDLLKQESSVGQACQGIKIGEARDQALRLGMALPQPQVGDAERQVRRQFGQQGDFLVVERLWFGRRQAQGAEHDIIGNQRKRTGGSEAMLDCIGARHRECRAGRQSCDIWHATTAPRRWRATAGDRRNTRYAWRGAHASALSAPRFQAGRYTVLPPIIGRACHTVLRAPLSTDSSPCLRTQVRQAGARPAQLHEANLIKNGRFSTAGKSDSRLRGKTGRGLAVLTDPAEAG